MRKIVSYALSKDNKTKKDQKSFVSLPYLPGISKKLRSAFKNAGFNTMFKSGRNLSSILTNRNKPKLPENSYPGVYKVPCKCLGNYIGHTGKQIRTRGKEHEKAVFLGHWNESALSEHTKECTEGVDWKHLKTIRTESSYYKRTVMEALEIQREEVCNPRQKIINDRAGLHVTTDTWKPILKKIGSATSI